MSKKAYRDRTKYSAKLVSENPKPCAFCQREVDDEITYGKLYSIGDIQCHYFCVLLSCCLMQKGKDEDGLFGFLYPDILAELERSKKHRCSYCSKEGATLGCAVSQCRKQFHLPCGRERNAVSLFYGNYKSFCKNHAPRQKVTENVMAKVKLRIRSSKNMTKPAAVTEVEEGDVLQTETVCVICYEEVECGPSPHTFWPPCCARDAWFHRSCVQRMALSAGMHYLKCPLCNDKEKFYQAVLGQGFYIPDRDAAWELEQNAFSEIYSRVLSCSLAACACEQGREYSTDTGPWDIKLCLFCGSAGAHARCLQLAAARDPPQQAGAHAPLQAGRRVCGTCAAAAPHDLDALAANIESVILSEQVRASPRASRPVMPSRMSLRRTKQRQAYYKSSTSSSLNTGTLNEVDNQESSNTTTSRQELNLSSPRAVHARDTENIERAALRPGVLRPAPLSRKREMVRGILKDLVNNLMKEEAKVKEPVRAWSSPKKEARDSPSKQDEELVTTEKIQQIKEETATNTPSTPDRPKKQENIKTVDTLDPEKKQDIKTENIKDKTENITAYIDLDEYESPIADKTKSENISLDDAKETSENVANEDDSSNSTFQLPPEFVADDSDNSLPIFETPKKMKTVEIQKDSSMEISENNDVINIDLVKIESEDAKNIRLNYPNKTDKCAFKFSPNNRESLKTNKMDIDVESFKNQYLNEVDRFKCNFNHKHGTSTSSFQLRNAIDFAVDAALKSDNQKRKNKVSKKRGKKRKMSGIVLQYENLDECKKRKQENTTEVSIQNDDMKVKISLKKKKFKLKIVQNKTEASPKSLKQYVLKYGPSNEVIGKPEKDVTPFKRKYVKQEKSPDNLIQTSIQSFFKGKTYKE